MKKHMYRTVLIWAVLVVGVVNIVPTVGWMMLSDDPAWLSLTTEEQQAITANAEERADELPSELPRFVTDPAREQHSTQKTPEKSSEPGKREGERVEIATQQLRAMCT